MSNLPIGGFRFSAPLSQRRLISQIHTDQTSIEKLYEQLSTGRRISRPSDDPRSSTKAILLNRGIDYSEQLLRNAKATESSLTSVDATLSDIFDQVNEARSTAVTAANNVLGQTERDALAQTIQENLNRVVSLVGSTVNGQYLFRGGQNDAPPLAQQPNYVLYNRSGGATQTIIDAGRFGPNSATAEQSLSVGEISVTGSVELNPTLAAESMLADLRGGQGIDGGGIRIAGSGGLPVEVDLSNATTLGDVVDTLDGLAVNGRSLDVQIVGDQLQIAYADGLPGVLAIEDLPGQSMARQLQIDNVGGFDPPPLQSRELKERLTSQTPLSRLAGGPLDLSSGIEVRQGNETYQVDLQGATTLGDVLVKIERSGADVTAEIEPASNRIAIRSLRSGVDIGIGENGGTAASQLGLRTATGSTRLADLNYGRGFNKTPEIGDFVIRRPDGVELEIDLTGATTVDDFIAAVQGHPGNQDPTTRVDIALATQGNGLVLSTAAVGAEPLSVHDRGANNIGKALGLIPDGADSAEAVSTGGGQQINGDDYVKIEPSGIVDVLMRLEAAVRAGNIGEIERLHERLQDETEGLYRTQVETGVQLQRVSTSRNLIEQQLVSFRDVLSSEIDTDFADVVSQLANQQASFEASMRLIGQTAQLSVLNFL